MLFTAKTMMRCGMGAALASSSRRLLSASGSPANVAGLDVFSVGRLNHCAFAVPDLKAASLFWRDVMGAQVSEPQDLPEHGVTTVFVNLPNTKFELLHPLGDKSPIANFLEKNKSGGVHHVCLEVSDIHQAMATFKEKKIRVLDPEPKIGAHGRPVVFLHPKDCNGVLVEVEEVKE